MTLRSSAARTSNQPESAFEPTAAQVLSLAARLAQSPLPLLVEGGRGADRLRLAHSIHARGPRATEAVVWIACETLDPHDLAPPLSHRPAIGQAGLFALALSSAGTVILDGVDRLSRQAQRWLLVTINRLARSADGARPGARIIALSERQLGALIMHEGFFGELYMRLSATTLEMPRLGDEDALITAVRERARRAQRPTWPSTPETTRAAAVPRPVLRRSEAPIISIGRRIRFKRSVASGARDVAVGTLGTVVSVLPSLCVEVDTQADAARSSHDVVDAVDPERDIEPVTTVPPAPSSPVAPFSLELDLQVERITTLPPARPVLALAAALVL